MFGLDNKSGINAMPPIAPADSQAPLWFTEGGAGLGATYPGQDWFNQVQAELLNVLKAADIAPQKGSLNQLSSAISKLASAYAVSIVHSTGQSLTSVMSQKAVTDLADKLQPKGKYAVTDSASTQLFTGPVISSDTVGAQNTDGKLKSFLFLSGGAAPAWGATENGRYAGALKHPLKDGTAATTDDVNVVKGLALGVGQAWQIVTRGNGATNTNNTGRTITVNVIRYTGVRGRVSVNGISVAAFRGGRTDTSPAVNVDMTVTAIVPPGAKYIISWDKDVADAGEPEIVELR